VGVGVAKSPPSVYDDPWIVTAESEGNMSTLLDSLLVKTPDVCGGRVRIDGTRITVHRIAVLYRQGQHAEDIAQAYPYLTLSQIYTALAYFHANRAEIESELAAADVEYEELKQQST
jgi:uncharacterized protein (DUF433 family)